uniref:Uncharacterized protein n=1 Tax=Solanum lycopersicum TaxID=4081 RepID=A0A3Q7F2B9_SOLLC
MPMAQGLIFNAKQNISSESLFCVSSHAGKAEARNKQLSFPKFMIKFLVSVY